MAPRTCTFHYTLKDSRGQLIDTSRGGAPMPFTEGTGQIIEGLEEPLLQMAIGEKRAEQFVLKLHKHELDALVRLSESNFRRPGDQLRFMIREAATAAGTVHKQEVLARWAEADAVARSADAVERAEEDALKGKY